MQDTLSNIVVLDIVVFDIPGGLPDRGRSCALSPKHSRCLKLAFSGQLPATLISGAEPNARETAIWEMSHASLRSPSPHGRVGSEFHLKRGAE
jgi:hypothetical protein